MASSLHSIFPKCMTNCVVVFDGRVARVVYDDIHQYCSVVDSRILREIVV